MWRHFVHRVVLMAVIGAALLTAGCSGVRVSESDEARSVADAVDGNSTLNILGVDFDPPLDYVEITRNQGVTLLVAVENRGQQVISDVRIVARLRYNGDTSRGLERQGVLPDLKPGAITVYRFPRMRNIPIRRSYTLDVQLLAPDGSQVLSQRSYRIRLVEQ